MSWGTNVIERLQQTLTTPKSGTTAVEHSRWRVEADVEMAGAVGLSARRLRLHAPDQTDLDEAGRTIAASVKYLHEPLRLLELSDERAMLRSAPPTIGETGNDYYEMWLTREDTGTTVDLQRYRYPNDARSRETIPLNLTWETAGRLLDDVKEAVDR